MVFTPSARAALLLVVSMLSVSCGCRPQASAPNQGPGVGPGGKYTIVTTCGMVTDIVLQVCGERAEVRGLMGTGVDPHLYKPTRTDVAELNNADLVFYVGLMLEGRMSDLFVKLASDGKPIFAVTQELEESSLREPPEFEGHFDPHVWMNVKAWSQCVAFVADELARRDPQGGDEYRRNAERYRAELAELDDYVRQVIATIPADQRTLVTAHDAFGYFGEAYGVNVRSVQGLTTESEPAIADINRLVDFMVSSKIRAIFVESSVPRKSVEAIIEGAGDRGWTVAEGGELFSDAMGPAGSYEGTYIGMIDHNATTIARALGGEAPERGWKGRLGVD